MNKIKENTPNTLQDVTWAFGLKFKNGLVFGYVKTEIENQALFGFQTAAVPEPLIPEIRDFFS
jgi:hypothetical protein